MNGSCHCKNIIFSTKKENKEAMHCHCADCQKLHGNYMSFLVFNWSDVAFSSENGLSWYAYSDKSKRGFCTNCGSRLFMKMNDSDRVLISAGVFDDTSQMKPIKNIFSESSGGYYYLPRVNEEGNE